MKLNVKLDAFDAMLIVKLLACMAALVLIQMLDDDLDEALWISAVGATMSTGETMTTGAVCSTDTDCLEWCLRHDPGNTTCDGGPGD